MEPQREMSLDDFDAVILGVDTKVVFGLQVAHLPDYDGDGQADVAVSTEIDSEPTNTGVKVFRGPIRGIVSSADAIAEFWEDGPVENGYDYPRFATGDLNCDGLGDVVIGLQEADLAGEDSGGVFVFFGPRTGRWSFADADVILAGEAAGNLAGEVVLDVGDMTGDGCTDVAVVAPYFDSRGDTHWNDGRVYLVGDVGAQSGSLGETLHIDPGDGVWVYYPEAMTASVAGSDGAANELWIATRLDEQDHDVRRIFRFEGPITTDVTTDDAKSYATSGLSNFEDNDLFSIGDIDGSGEAEMITQGFGPEIGYLLHYDPFDQGELDDDVPLHCCSLFSQFESVGDLDSDAYGDFMASATGSGQLYLVFGRRGPLPSDGLPGAPGTYHWDAGTYIYSWYYDDPLEMGYPLGSSMDKVGDQDGDGVADVALSAPKILLDDVEQSAVFLLYSSTVRAWRAE